MKPPRVLIAPDAFKGALANTAAAAAITRGLNRAWPDARLTSVPLADGGDGTLRALAAAERGAEITRGVHGPQGEALQAAWWQPESGPAVVEMARASGMAVTRHRRPLTATTYGTGQLLAAAIAAGNAEVFVTCGGSATSDGGAGALQALGFELLDAQGRPLGPGGGALAALAHIVVPRALPAAKVVVLADVRNPLTGPDGAAAVYGPQKGADPAAVARLDAGLDRFAAVCAATFGRDPRDLPGAGAAGGLPAGLWAALGAELRPGFDTLAARVGLDAALADADLVVTAEGRVDHQTPRGKTVAGVVARAADRGLPVWVFAGEITPDAEDWAPPHVALIPIGDGPRSLDDSVAHTAALLERAAARAARLGGLHMA